MMRAAALEMSPPGSPSASAVMRRAGGENFPVAARVLSRRHRRRLLAIYGFARLADELGDELPGDRLAALDWLQDELDRAYAGAARHPLLVRVQDTLAQCALPREAFARLIEANRVDQRVHAYESWEQLRGYCALSANPVGELVLHAFELATPERIALSDDVCTALQLIEHLQDVAEDAGRGRVYLPEEDLRRCGSVRAELLRVLAQGTALRGSAPARENPHRDGPRGELDSAPARVRAAVALEVARAWELLARGGPPLVAGVAGRPKLALAGFVAGGRAALRQIERAGFEVIGAVPDGGSACARRARLMRELVAVLSESRGR